MADDLPPSRANPSGIRDISKNVQNAGWNTVTAALWKGDRTLSASNNEQVTRQLSADESISSENEGFPFHANSFPTGFESANATASPRLESLRNGEAGQSDHHAIMYEPLMEADEEEASEVQPRQNVQFAQITEPSIQTPSQAPNGSPIPGLTDRPSHFRNSSLMSKILALSPSLQGRNHEASQLSSFQADGEQSNAERTPRSRERGKKGLRSRSAGGEADVDADAEDNEEEGDEEEEAIPTASPKLRQRRRKLRDTTSEYPATGRGRKKSPSRHLPYLPRRSATVMEERQGVSEDEGRDRLARQPVWRRKSSSWLHRDSDQTGEGTADRPTSRRLWSLAAGGSAVSGSDPAAHRVRHEGRAHDAWQKIRNSMKQIVQKTKAEQIDQTKSAELMAELLAGSPAALILASSFQRDEREKKRIPVLLEQLKISIPSSSPAKDDSNTDRHVSFHVELEYGSGLMRMKWTIERTLRDFANLHLKYKLQSGSQKISRKSINEDLRTKLPKFPKSAFPILRQVRGFADDEDDEETAEEADDLEPQASATRSDNPRSRNKRHSSSKLSRRGSSSADMRRGDTISPPNGTAHGPQIPNLLDLKKENFNSRQRRKLEQYLQRLIRFVIFRAGSNRLCRFLELSALGIRLASEASYHGKEGILALQSGKGIDFRRSWRPGLLIQRHKPMWFLVRHSYLVCVDSPEEMNIYDVFLVDSGFQVQARRPRLRDQTNVQDFTRIVGTQARHPQTHFLRVQNHERKLRLVAKNERHLQQFEDSLRLVSATTDWALKNRFDSFAPVRRNVFAQWLVDGRDYMWNVSRAISMARDVIYIHDWWLSPEIYMRRPAAISQKWRLDRLLQRKAEEGVKIFVIVYRNINSAIPIDSEYTKFSLLDLHPNIFVQRSPNQMRERTFFWAHHEKICVVDHVVAFCGGVDICFGRWDTPQHTVTDDKPTGFESTTMPLDADHCQLWPGKDYSNPRVLDFFKLDEPYGEMYDRTKVPRMPWHDIGMQIVGQPARDLSRHFIQRWNYILRQRKPTRPTPFLLPPPNFAPNEIETLGLDGTCDVQILRSACEWSIGTPHRVEHSIMNAYVRLIQASDHFVYIENQFFITSCQVENERIRNGIGDALVERIIRAHAAGEKWRAIIVIPLMPGFQNTVDAQDGSSIRLIMQCQYRSIDRGETSIFERLRSVGITPEDYIDFYSLRSWGKIGPTKALVTEQLYIHAKCMVVDDRYAIIGSANINERSMLGERDSEVAAVICDTDMIDSTMAGSPYKVGRFPHTLRMRLMREHLGVDVDAVMDEEREEHYRQEEVYDEEVQSSGRVPSDADRSLERKLMQSKHRMQDDLIARYEEMHSFNHDVDWEQANNPHLLAHKAVTKDVRVTGNKEHKADVDGHRFDQMAIRKGDAEAAGRETVVLNGDREVLLNSTSPEGKGTLTTVAARTHALDDNRSQSIGEEDSTSTAAALPPRPPRMQTQELGLTLASQLPPLPVSDDTDIGGPPLLRQLSQASEEAFNPLLANMRRPVITEDCMRDPINNSFFKDVWHSVAANNTKLFRQVFRCMPDSKVTNWREYEAANAYAEKFAHSQGMSKSHTTMQQETHGATGPPGHGVSILTNPLERVKSKLQSAGGEEIDRSDEADRVRDASTHKSGDASTHKSISERSPSHRTGSWSEQQQQEETIRERDYQLNEKHQGMHDVADKIGFAALPRKDDGDHLSEKTSLANGDLGGAEPAQAAARRRKRTTTKSSGGPMYGPDYMPSREDAEELLKLVQGHLVEWPYDWLVQEEKGGKWLYTVDQIAPLEIYN